MTSTDTPFTGTDPFTGTGAFADGHATYVPPAAAAAAYPSVDAFRVPDPSPTTLAARPVDNGVDNEVVVDLDAYEKPDKKPPFGFWHDGRKWRMRDPGDADWQQQWAARQDPRLMMRLLIDPAQRDDLFSREMSADKLAYLMGLYREHYGLDANPAGDQPL